MGRQPRFTLEDLMDFKLELVLIPVADVDRAKKFYLENAGFSLLVDTPIADGKRIVQITPPGSACSIGFGTGVTEAEPGSAQGLHLVVPDIEVARRLLTTRGVPVTEIRHVGSEGWQPGVHPEHADYSSFADFTDPDGNIWILQEVGHNAAEG
jgi:catechol 2,3-dioxygenase-like lactoylglutathione lyase family enzyme